LFYIFFIQPEKQNEREPRVLKNLPMNYKNRSIELSKCLIFSLILIFSLAGNSLGGKIDNVLIISIDALHPAALSAKTSKNIYKLMRQGVFTLNGYSTDPPLTLLAHSSMFTGLSPKESGRFNNNWRRGEPSIKSRTLFDQFKSLGYKTGFFYSKDKLGYLVNKSVDRYKLDREFSLENSFAFFKDSYKKKFCFLHISGLDRVGPSEGWLSRGYLEEFFYIDENLAPLIQKIRSMENYLIIITSDHAGHDKIHGTNHPDDSKLPLVMISDVIDLKKYQGIKYSVTQLKSILEVILGH